MPLNIIEMKDLSSAIFSVHFIQKINRFFKNILISVAKLLCVYPYVFNDDYMPF